MNIVYVIMVYGMLHNVESIIPGTYQSMNDCQAAAAQTHLTFGNWAQCQPLAATPAAKGHMHRHYR